MHSNTAHRNSLSLVDFIAFCRDFHLTEILFLGESQTAVMENLYFHSSAQVNCTTGIPEWASVCLFPHFLDCLARLSIIAFPTGQPHLHAYPNFAPNSNEHDDQSSSLTHSLFILRETSSTTAHASGDYSTWRGRRQVCLIKSTNIYKGYHFIY